MQTAQDFRRGAITLANLKGPLRTAQRHVERRAAELKAIGPVGRRLQNGYLDVLDRATTRSNGQLELQVIEAMRRAVQVEEAEARGEQIGWLVPEDATHQFWVEISNASEFHEGGVIRAELQDPLSGDAINGFAPGGCQRPSPLPVQIDPEAARPFISLARRKQNIANDILHTAVDTIAPLGLNLQPCSAIAEAMRTYEQLADYVRRVSRRVVMFDRAPEVPIPGDVFKLPPRSETPNGPMRRFELDGFTRDETTRGTTGTFRLAPGVFTMPSPDGPTGRGSTWSEGQPMSDGTAPMTGSGVLRPSPGAFGSQPFSAATQFDSALWTSTRGTPATD